MGERGRPSHLAGRGPGSGPRPMALLAAVVLLGGCSLPGTTSSEETTPAPTPAEASATGAHVEGDDGEYGAACTGDGDHTIDSSAEYSVDDLPGGDGEELTVALGFTAPDGPRVRLYVSTLDSGEQPVQWEGQVGDVLEHEGRQLTVTSICANEVRFDVADVDPHAAG